MTCSRCGNAWELLRAHIIRTDRMPEGCIERIQCPRCGAQQEVTRPIIECSEDD